MPFSMKKLLADLTGQTPGPVPVFDPPNLTPLRKPIAQSKIGMFVSCGAQLLEDPPLGETEDISFRLLHRDTPLSKLVISHKTAVRKWAQEDLNVAYPLDRMKELETEGTIGGSRSHGGFDRRIDTPLYRIAGADRAGGKTDLRFPRS